MKKRNPCIVLAVMLVLALIVGGCTGPQANSLQTVGQDVEEWVCDPPANVVALAVAADPFISIAAAAGGPEALLAYKAVTAILSSGVACATVKEVNALIAFLGGLKTKAMAPAFDVTPLENWLKAKGK